MAAPKYFVETRYSHLEDLRRYVAVHMYEVDTPETNFERQVQADLAKARTHHLHEEFGLALTSYEHVRGVILKTLYPHLKLEMVHADAWQAPKAAALLKPLIASSARMLNETPATSSSVPTTLSGRVTLPADALRALQPFATVGLQVSSRASSVALRLERAGTFVEAEDWDSARDEYALALKEIPDTDTTARAYVLRDIALLDERRGLVDAAGRTMQQAIALFEQAQLPQGRYHATGAMAGILERQGKPQEAAVFEKQAVDLSRQFGLHGIAIDRRMRLPGTSFGRVTLTRSRGTAADDVAVAGTGVGDIPYAALETIISGAAAGSAFSVTDAVFLAQKYAAPAAPDRTLTLLTSAGAAATIKLGTAAETNLTTFYEQMAVTTDIALLHGYALSGPAVVAYLPYIYYFVLPMAIGDVYASMGQFARAEQEYMSALNYQYLNTVVEAVKVWTRLAELYVAWGDAEYRAARNDAALIAALRQRYERIITRTGVIPTTSPLYSHAKLAGLLVRAQAVAAAADATTLAENPAVVTPILKARMRLQQIGAGLNFFAFSPTYVPPFSFEYLQNTARYFAQHAAAVEQSYIQFKSQAENEEFRREQMDQQAELARASVELERRGLEEARAGVAVADASVAYAETQRQNAVAAQSAFAAVRWELLELAELEAWSSGAAVDEDDEVQQTISGYTYYNVDSADRSDVLSDLARRRTRISHDLEAGRLAREVASATAYKAVAQAQRNLAQTRVAVAEQRIAIAQLQQRQAVENRDFLDMKEFSARLWYELARAVRQISQQYLDMAIEIAALMERAYEAETGRNLRKIKFDYGNSALNDLLGADMLLRDIDYFTLDYITTTRSKKTPVKVTLSLADHYPMAFDRLKRTGQTFLETRLEQFDRAYPGLYLQKLQNVELIFVGLTGSAVISGSLRNIGVSTFRSQTGATRQQVYPSDVMPLSQYEVRQDALVFRANPNDLRLFENNGIATMWQIDLPPGANDFDPRQVLDVHLVLYFDAFHDEQLEATIRAALPATGTASRATSLRMFYPDELFYLRSHGEASLPSDASLYPHNQTALTRTSLALRVTGTPALVGGLAVRLRSAAVGADLLVTLGADGVDSTATAGSPLAPLVGLPVIDSWTVLITPDDNPGKVDPQGALDRRGITDVQIFQEYSFTYR